MASPPATSSCPIGVFPGRHPLFTALRQLTHTTLSQPAEAVAWAGHWGVYATTSSHTCELSDFGCTGSASHPLNLLLPDMQRCYQLALTLSSPSTLHYK